MSLFTLITRLADGFPLVASTDAAPAAGLETAKSQAKALAKRLSPASPRRQVVDAGAFFICYAAEGELALFVVTDRAHPKRLAFGYLSDVAGAFQDELARQHGDEPGGWRAALQRVERPYSYLAFDRAMQRCAREYADTQSRANQARLAGDLGDINNIMRQNISELLDRGDKLGALASASAKLKEDSKKFRWGAKRLNVMDWLAKAAPAAGVAALVGALVWWRFFW